MSGFTARLSNWWAALRRPSMRYSLLTLLVVGFGGGILFWGGFNTAMEATNTMPFCTSCHEMKTYLYEEYSDTIHHQNRTGVQATCSDCHVPKEWTHKMVRKIQASRELYHWALGSIRTPEKFDEKRLTLAKNVWASMKKTDSRECRNCHTLESMNPEFQQPRARKSHLAAMEVGNTCIDCHKGIAHKNLRDRLTDEELEELEQPLLTYVREIPESYREGMKRAEEREAEAEARRKAEIEQEAQRRAVEIAAAAAKEAAEAAAAEAAAKAEAGGEAEEGEASAPAVAAPAGAPQGGIDWSGVEAQTVTLFYPGQASFEWIQGREHGGSRAFTRGGDRCSDCHGGEVRDMGAKIVSGEKLEETPIPGKRAYVDVSVQAAHDGEKLHFRFQWADTAHAPVPFVDGGRMDPENQVKLSVMFAGEGVERADQAGCWTTCHHDARYMPDAPDAGSLASSPAAGVLDLSDGITKYIAESRTAIELKGGPDKPRGGGTDLVPQEDIAGMLESGVMMDLMRFLSGAEAENGHVLEQRVRTGGAEIEASGQLDAGTWTVVMSRPLASTMPGDVSIEPGKLYTVSFALHDDYSGARFHHVSLEKRFGIDSADAEINAAGR